MQEGALSIWYVVRTDDDPSYDIYESFVCIASNEQEARQMHPSGLQQHWTMMYNWITLDKMSELRVQRVGVALEGAVPGVILASYIAG